MKVHANMIELPEIGEIVLGKIARIMDYGVIVELIEYPGVQGFVHISNVASGWVKNIRNFVKEDQIRVAEVMNINQQKEQIDLSFTKVSPTVEKQKLEEYRQTKRSQKLIELMATELKISPDAAWDAIGKPLSDNYESLYHAFQEILVNGADAAKGVDKKYHKVLLSLVEKNVETPIRTVKGILVLRSNQADGIFAIKNALIKARDSVKPKEMQVKASLSYLGSGKFLVKVESQTIKLAEKALKQVADIAMEQMKQAKGSAEFSKSE